MTRKHDKTRHLAERSILADGETMTERDSVAHVLRQAAGAIAAPHLVGRDYGTVMTKRGPRLSGAFPRRGLATVEEVASRIRP